ncbi:hypothetical protein ACVGV5_00285, partial [Enterobacter sichuanensis]
RGSRGLGDVYMRQLVAIALLVLTALFAPWLASVRPHMPDPAPGLEATKPHQMVGNHKIGRVIVLAHIYGTRPGVGLVALIYVINPFS